MDSYCSSIRSCSITDSNWRNVVQHLVHKTQDENVHLNNSQKADLLKTMLETVFRNEFFYVIVFNDCDNGRHFAYDGNNEQIICSMKRGLCNVIVYHSRDWKRSSQAEQSTLIDQLKACRNNVIPYWADYRGFPLIVQNKHIRNTGMVGLFPRDMNIQVRSVNAHNYGPGYWIYAKNKVAGKEFVLMAAYK